MDFLLPAGCGNSPRSVLVGEVTRAWAANDWDAVAEHLADNVEWKLVGEQTFHGLEAAREALVDPAATKLKVLSIITHGKHAGCDGIIETNQEKIAFAHIFTFTGAVKTARIATLRSYLTEA